jgi:regulatory protein SWI5
MPPERIIRQPPSGSPRNCNNDNMLSNSSSAIEQRRKAHRRQHSTPIAEMPHIAPAHSGFQRANQARGHRRGLSLDNRSTTYEPTHRMTPTLGPISQDDIAVSITTNPGPMTQHHMQFAQSHELVQPGQPTDHYNPMNQAFQMQPIFTPTDNEQNYFPPSPFSQQAPETQSFQNLSPSPHVQQSHSFTHSPNPQCPQPVDQTQAHIQHFEAAKRQLEAHLGAQINIAVLPTPVQTPPKRTSVASPEKLDVAPNPFSIPETSDVKLDPLHIEPAFDFSPVEQQNLNSVYESPHLSPHLSPQALSPHHSFVGSQRGDLSPVTTLIDVEEFPSSSIGSPARPVSFADLSLGEYNGSIVETGIPPEEVEKYISPQDPETRQYYCLVEGCNKSGGFNRRENIRAHVQTHLGDRAFKCNVCEQCFVRQNDLKRHHGIHKSMKPFSCECGSRFARHDALTRHKQRGCCSVHTSPLRPERKKPGRPKKHRPELDDRVSKAQKQRQLNAERVYDSNSALSSGSEFSPSPHTRQTEFASFDSTTFGDVVLASSPPAERDESPCPSNTQNTVGTEQSSGGIEMINPTQIE